MGEKILPRGADTYRHRLLTNPATPLSSSMAYLEQTADHTVSLSVYIQTRASANRIVGLFGDAVKVAITSPPVDGKANKALIAFIAKLFHLPKSSVTLISGHQSRNKHLLLAGVSLDQAGKVLADLLA